MVERAQTYDCCPRVDAVLNQLFDYRTQVNNDLPGLNLMDLAKTCERASLITSERAYSAAINLFDSGHIF